MAGVQRRDVGGGDLRTVAELAVQPVDRRLPPASAHPVDEAQRPEVLAAQSLLLGQAGVLPRVLGLLRHVDLDDAEPFVAVVGPRVAAVAGLGSVPRAEGVGVEDLQALRLTGGTVHFPRTQVPSTTTCR